MDRDTLKWLLIAVLLGFAFLLWLYFDDIQAFVEEILWPTSVIAPSKEKPSQPVPPEKAEIKSLHPGPKPGEKVYTEEDIKRLNEQRELPARHPATYTNADLRKYHIRPSTDNIEKVRQEIKWAEEPEKKKTTPENKFTRPRNPSR